MTTRMQLGDVSVEVIRKDIKNLHLSVHPPTGRVRISAPLRMNMDAIRVFAVTKLGWIRRQQQKLRGQEREPPREYLDLESHYVWGGRYLLKVEEGDAPPGVELGHREMRLRVRPGWDEERRQAVVDEWYRSQLRQAIPPLIAKWEGPIGVKVERVFLQRMKTRWGSSNYKSKCVRLNTELAKKPPACLEYIVVHEMIHLIEPTHNARFTALMDQFMPTWRINRAELNSLPVRHEDWIY